MPWGIFLNNEDDTSHVVPCDKDSYMRKPHILSLDCICHPREDKEDFSAITVIVHEEIN